MGALAPAGRRASRFGPDDFEIMTATGTESPGRMVRIALPVLPSTAAHFRAFLAPFFFTLMEADTALQKFELIFHADASLTQIVALPHVSSVATTAHEL